MDTFTTQAQVELCALTRIHKLMLFLVSGVTVVDIAKLSNVTCKTGHRFYEQNLPQQFICVAPFVSFVSFPHAAHGSIGWHSLFIKRHLD